MRISLGRVLRASRLPLLGAIALTLITAPLPAGLGRWSSLGPYGGAVGALAVDPVHSDVIYAATWAGGGVFKSTDGGATWSQMSHGLPQGFQGSALAIDPLHPSTLYVANPGGRGPFKSVDGGATWASAGAGLRNAVAMVNALAVDPQHPDTLYAGTDARVIKTVDGGRTWAMAGTGIPPGRPISALAIDPSAPATVYAQTGVGNVGIFKTKNGGASWTAVGSAPPLGDALAVDPSHPQTVYAGGSGVFKTTDGGVTWRESSQGVGSVWVYALAIAPGDSRSLYAGTAAGVFKSRDGGATWVSASQGLPSGAIGALAVGPRAGAIAYAGTALGNSGMGGVFKTTAGAVSWSASFQGLSALGVDWFAVNPVSPSTLYAHVDGVGLLRSTDSGATWSPASGLTSGSGAIVQDPLTPTTLYVVGGCGGSAATHLCRSLDGGATWAAISTPAAPGVIAIAPWAPFDLYLAGAAGFLRSTDGGANWTASAGDIAQATIRGIAADAASSGTLYAFGEIPGRQPFPPPLPRLYKSVDRGVSWEQIQGNLPDSSDPLLHVSDLVVDAASATLFAAVSGQAVRSLDGGATWSVIYTPDDRINANLATVVLAPTHPTTLYVPFAGPQDTVRGNLVASTDGGDTWQTVDPPGLVGTLQQLIVDPRDPRHLLARVVLGGVQDLTLSGPTPCVATPTALCLGDGRFKVEAAWATSQSAGAGQAVGLTADTGYFWFFGASNVEVLVKILDGCSLNGHHWVFASGLTDVGVSLRITDSATGFAEVYPSTSGTAFPPIQDTSAFATCP